MIVVSLFKRCYVILFGMCLIPFLWKVFDEFIFYLINSLEVFLSSHPKIIKAEALILAVSNLRGLLFTCWIIIT